MYYALSHHVVRETFDDETILINLGTGVYYSLNRTGSRLLDLLDGGRSVAVIVQALQEEYRTEAEIIEPGVQACLGSLHREGLVEILEAESLAPGSARLDGCGLGRTVHPGNVEPFETPRLSRFDDMRELLLLDPIHEVDETGWPSVKPREPAIAD